MTTLISRRHHFKFYLTIILGVIFFLGMGLFFIVDFIESNNQNTVEEEDYLMLILAVGFLLMAFYTVIQYYKNAPRIIVDNNFISFNSDVFSLSDIERVSFTGKKDFPFLADFPMEAATVYFKDGDNRIIFDDMYENSWELKSFLKQVVIEKRPFSTTETNRVNKSDLNNEYYDTYKNNQFTSLRGLSLWSLPGFFLYSIVTDTRNPIVLLIFIAIFSLFWIILHAWLMHYFKVSNKYIVVTNHIFFWKKQGFRLSNISEIVFETRQNMPNCLRIITKDYKNKFYPAGTLHDKTWLDLKDRLEINGIKVRNECIN